MKQKIAAIQDLRGIAVLYVVLFHVGNICGYRIFIHGATGVSLFFIISGFIIAFVHKNDRGVRDAVIFIKKRMARIYPPFIITMFVTLFLFVCTGMGSDFHRDIINIARNILLIQLPTQSIHPYSWSLVYELYYYLTFCLFVIIFRINIILYATLMAMPFIIMHYGFGINADADMIVFKGANIFFGVGAIAGYFFDKLKFETGYIATSAALLLFIATPFLYKGFWLFLAVTAILFIVYLQSRYSIGFLNKIGNASYSIYLIHAIVLMILKTVIKSRNVYIFVLLLVVSLLSGYLYYVFVEKKMIRLAYKLLRIG